MTLESFSKYIRDIKFNLNINEKLTYNKIKEYLLNSSELTDLELAVLLSTNINYLSRYDSDYSILSSRILMRNLHLNILSFEETIKLLYDRNIVSETFYNYYNIHKDIYNEYLDLTRDYKFDYFGFKTLEKNYLFKIDNRIMECPQYMYMRVAITIGQRDIEKIKGIYDYLSKGYISFGTPTLYNSGLEKQQLSSCFLLGIEKDSLEDIIDTLGKVAKLSKYSGGIGMHIHNIRAKGSPIISTNGTSSGIIPMLRVFNETSKYIDQGGKRRASYAIYLEPWHKDIVDFLEIRKQRKSEDLRCLDLFTAIWMPDLFMKRVEENGEWTLFCPSDALGLHDKYGKEFEELYTYYEKCDKLKDKKIIVSARQLMQKIIESQIETGTPYILYKDHCNKKSNQKNIGVIKSSNLCAEVVEFSDYYKIAVCNLASIALPKFVNDALDFDYEKFGKVVQDTVHYLNSIIDINYYPLREAEYSNRSSRPIGIGVQGLADVFFKLRIPYNSDKAKEMNIRIFETLYYNSLVASCDLAEKYGPYEFFKDSPASKGILQFDMWKTDVKLSLPFDQLKERIKKYGLRNSLIVSLMPTASTSQILGNTECFEPQTSNIYKRQTLTGEYLVVNKYLVRALKKLGLWNEEMLNNLIKEKGSVKNLFIPCDLKEVYKTVWELPQKDLIDMAADRGVFICHSQSMNLWFDSPDYNKLYSAHMYGWKKGLKTGSYYVRIRPARDAVQMTVTDCEACVI